MNGLSQLTKLADDYYQGCQKLIKLAFIKKLPNGKYRVVSHKGKNLGTYNTKDEAVVRLRQVEFFKHHDKNKAEDTKEKPIDLTDIDDFSYSAIMRKMRARATKEQVREYLKLFKSYFDKAVKSKLQKPERVALQNSLIRFNKLHPIHLNRKLTKKAAVSELGSPAEVGQYLANIIRFILNRLEPDKRSRAMESLRNKFYYANANELASKKSPPSASIGQAITFVKHVLFNQDSTYIRQVLNNIAKNLY